MNDEMNEPTDDVLQKLAKYRCDLCATRFNDEDIVLGTRPFESLSPCCNSEEFALTKEASQHYKDMLKVAPITVKPVSTFNLEEEARKMILRLTREEA